ncbi:MAG: AI-2E family transporter [Microlunatus sp.]|nr:AI-2E family transporter [Microlunatus sp.]MDN5769664.1 AI-2E family transporter [Microlunatus sp.]
MTESTPPPPRVISRAVTVLVAGASALVLVVGLRYFSGIIGPLFLALVLTVTVHPLRRALSRGRLPGWFGTVVALICVFVVLLGLSVAIVAAGAQLAGLLGDYSSQFDQLKGRLVQTLHSAGIDKAKVESALGSLDVGKLAGFVGGLLGGVAALAGNVVLILGLLLFMGLDAGGYTRVLQHLPVDRQPLGESLGQFAVATRRYFLVATVFGLIVALLDVGVLYLLGVPAPWLWGLLAFITNYIPNIGFVIGLIPPALLALVGGGWQSALLVVLLYAVINAVVQSGIQPKVVGDSVGLSATLSFVSLIFWAFVLGAWGALLAIPLSLFARALLIDVDTSLSWIRPLLSGQHLAHPSADDTSPSAGAPAVSEPASS